MFNPSLLRLLNIFGNREEEEDPTLQGVVSDLPGGGWDQAAAERKKLSALDQIMSSINQSESGPAMEAYTKHLSSMPERQPRSGLAKVLTGISGAFLGPERALKSFDMPHERAMGDWKAKAQSLSEPARFEESGMLKRRQQGLDLADIVRKKEYGDQVISERKDYHEGSLANQEAERQRKLEADEETARHHRTTEKTQSARTSQYGRLVDARVGHLETQRKLAEAKANNPTALEQLRADTAENLRIANAAPEVGKYMKWERGHLIRDWQKIAKLPEIERVALEAKLRKLGAGEDNNDINLDVDSDYEEVQ